MTFYSDPHLELKVWRAGQRELERKLELARQLREARVDQPGVLVRLLLGVGDLLIALGWKLKGRYEPASLERFPAQSIGFVVSEPSVPCHLWHRNGKAGSGREALEFPKLGMVWGEDAVENAS